METHLIEVDPLTQIQTFTHYDHANDIHYVEEVQDVEPIIEYAKGLHRQFDERSRWGDIAQVAEIPNTIVFELMRDGILTDQKRMKKWLNDPANAHFRTRPGRV